MLKISMERVRNYAGVLERHGVDAGKRRHDHRWPRFFLDYCRKYGAAPLNPASLVAFDG